MRSLPQGLRARLVLMVLVAVGGALALEVADGVTEHNRVVNYALADASLVAHLAAGRAEHAIATLPPGEPRRLAALAALVAASPVLPDARDLGALDAHLVLVGADGAWPVESARATAGSAALVAARPPHGRDQVQALRLDGRRRATAWVPVGSGTPLWVVAVCDLEAPLAAQRRALWRDLLLLAALGALVTFAAWHGADVFVLRRVNAMLAATARLRAGDLTARTGLEHGRSELDTLAREFDGMAAALQHQVAEQQRAEASLRLSEARKSAVLEASLDGILVLDEQGRVEECNAAVRAMFGCTETRCVHHRLVELFPGELAFDPRRFNRPQEVFETSGRRFDGADFPAEVSIAPIRTSAAPGLFVATVRDITERKHFERTLEALSFEDELTGVYNRRGFLMFATQQLKLAARNGQRVVMVSVDLDGLKAINDTFGHANGDRALVELANALRRSFRETDVIGRLGGDEFIVLAVESEHLGAEAAIERVAMRLAGRNGEGDLPWTLSASIGWLRADPAQNADLSGLLAEVDARMYSQKRRLHPEPARGPSLERRRFAPAVNAPRFVTTAAKPAAPSVGAPGEPALRRTA